MTSQYPNPSLNPDDAIRFILEILGEMASIRQSFENIAAALVADTDNTQPPPTKEDPN